jgi:hypothetical protein
MIYQLAQDDPIVTRALALDTPNLTEVGFISGDENGCKFYARKVRGQLMILGIHSRSYGCNVVPVSNGVRIMPSVLQR